MLASLEFVDGSAIGALRFASVGHIEVNLGVAVPELHVSLGIRAIDTTLMVQVLGKDFHNRSIHKLP
jgi:hypothetical protein